MQDWYAVLHVAHDAPEEVVRAAYRVLSQKWHPDRNLEDPTAIGRMMEINQAYDVLSDAAARAEFDCQWTTAQHAWARKQSATTQSSQSSSASTKPAAPATVCKKIEPAEQPALIQRQVRFWFMVIATAALLAMWLFKSISPHHP